MERTKRKTAGKRMGALVGKALEQDDAFWGHDTWAEDSDSGNDSFHDSDEDSANKKDEFDSDFNDSESDHEDEEMEAGMEAERELKRAERSNHQKSNAYKDIASAGRAMMQKKKAKGSRRVVGDGMNAGIVLNFPPPSAASATLPLGQPLPPGVAQLPLAPTAPSKKSSSKSRDPLTLASTRERRSQQMLKRLRENRSTAPGEKYKKLSRPSATKKAKRRKYGQEELILEAIHETEPENRRWLLARKRVQDLADQDKDSLSGRDKAKGKVVQKYHSRRGCLNTLTFPEMDHVPDILTRSSASPQKSDSNICVVTGKPAKYRDPRTKLGYHDIAAFKELRRREEAGEPLDQRKKEVAPKSAETTTTTTTPSAPIVPTVKSSTNTQTASAKKQSQPTSSVAKKVSPSVPPKAPAPKAAPKPPDAKKSTAAAPKKSTSKKPASAGGTGSKAKAPQKNEKSSASKATKTPETAKPVVSALKVAEASPVSPGGTRQSGRKWKPSAKLLENISLSGEQKKAGALSLGIHLKPQLEHLTAPKLNDTGITPQPLPGPPLNGTAENQNTPDTSKSAETTSAPAPVAPSAALVKGAKKTPAKPTSGKKEGAKTPAKKAGKTTAKPKTPAARKEKAAPNANGSSKPTKGATAKTKKATGKTAACDKKAKVGSTVSKDPVGGQTNLTDATSGIEKVYMIPAEDTSADNGPRFITQSELIMAAIANYNKSKDEKK